MKLTIKTLQQSTFTVTTEPDKTVKDLKEQIEKEHGKDYPSGAQKLIYSGKILADETKLSEYNIDEKKFIVLMITRPPPAPKPPVSEQKSASTSSIKTEPKATDDKSSLKSSTTSSSHTTAVSSATGANQPATRSSARLSSTNNPPAPTPNQATAATITAPPLPPRNDESSILAAMSEPQIATRLAMLISQPQFRQIQDHIQQSPHLLSQTIESLAASDPEMYNFISDNPDVFVNALNHPPAAGLRPQAPRIAPGGQQQQQHGRPAEGQMGSGAEQLVVNVSEHDKEAIERLKELGFSEYLAYQAYMACDKDEQLAANLLFHMDP